MENIERKFFHGISLSTYESCDNLTTIKVLELILKSGRILSRQDLMIENPYIYHCINPECRQKYNQVCVASHPNSNIFILPDNRDKFNIPKYRNLDAFYDWVFPTISIILSEKIIMNHEYSTAGGLPREIMIDNSIDLRENIEAIGYHDEITQIINTIENLNKIEDYENLLKIYCTYYYNNFLRIDPENIIDIQNYINEQYVKYNQIKELLEKYKYGIQIVDPFTGEEHKQINDSIINAQKVLLKRKEIIISKNRKEK